MKTVNRAVETKSKEGTSLGFPLRTGFDKNYCGQATMWAWETRCKTLRGGTKIFIPYLISRDQATRLSRIAGPVCASHEEAIAWLAKNYSGGRSWTDETNGTAEKFLY